IAAQAVQDINLIGSGLAGALPALASGGVVSASAVASIASAVGKVQQIASSITGASTQAQGQTAIQNIETLLNSIVSTAAGLQLPMPFGPALSAASALLPVIEV